MCTEWPADGHWEVQQFEPGATKCDRWQPGEGGQGLCSIVNQEVLGYKSWMGAPTSRPSYSETNSANRHVFKPHHCRIEYLNHTTALQRLRDKGIGLIDMCGDSTADETYHTLHKYLGGWFASPPHYLLNVSGGEKVQLSHCLSGLHDPHEAFLKKTNDDPNFGFFNADLRKNEDQFNKNLGSGDGDRKTRAVVYSNFAPVSCSRVRMHGLCCLCCCSVLPSQSPVPSRAPRPRPCLPFLPATCT